MGLDECFSNIRGQILLMQPMPNATKAYTMLRQEEKQREAVTPKHLTPTVMNTFTNPTASHNTNTAPNNRQTRTTFTLNTRRSAFKPGGICGNYQKEGHYKSESYQLVGYPVGHPLHGKFKPGTSGQGGQNRANRQNGQRTVNLVAGQSGQDNNAAETSTSGSQADDEVYAKMDSL